MNIQVIKLDKDTMNEEWLNEIINLWNLNTIETADCELDENDKVAIREQLKQYIQSKYGLVVVVMNQNQQIIGYGIASIKKDLISGALDGQLDEVYVVPAYRKNQLGKSIVDTMIKWLKQENIDLMYVYVDLANPSALKFWEKNGFEREFFVLSNND